MTPPFPPFADPARRRPRYAVIIPAYREAACIGPVLDELRAVLDPADYLVSVGVNGRDGSRAEASDATAEIARRRPGTLVAETPRRGYGHGCRAAVELVEASGFRPEAYLFFAGDGANDPRDLARLVAAHRAGHPFVLGCRTRGWANRPVMGWSHLVANRALGGWCGLLTGRFYADLGPLRLMSRELFWRLDLREWTYGWTIEAQVRAAQLGVRAVEVPVRERRRLAGEQKVSKVNWRRTCWVGWQIARAAWRTARSAPSAHPALPPLLPPSPAVVFPAAVSAAVPGPAGGGPRPFSP